mgnify:CR=1 FL=1
MPFCFERAGFYVRWFDIAHVVDRNPISWVFFLRNIIFMGKLFRSLISLIVLLLPNPVLAQVDTILGIKFVCSGSQIDPSETWRGMIEAARR